MRMRRYLTKLFDRWQMHWTIKQVFPLADLDGSSALWRASLTARATGKTVEVDGMDLVLIEGGRVKRNEVYYDRARLPRCSPPSRLPPPRWGYRQRELRSVVHA